VRGKNVTVSALAFSPDGKTLASSGQDRRIILWDGATGAKVREWQLPEEAKALAFAPDSRHLATANDTGDVFLLRTAAPK
jgi:WD40 repeat protein